MIGQPSPTRRERKAKPEPAEQAHAPNRAWQDHIRIDECEERVLSLKLAIEFVEDGTPMRVAMTESDCSFDLGLRRAPARASARASALSEFHPHAIGVPTWRGAAWRERLDELRVRHVGIVSGNLGRAWSSASMTPMTSRSGSTPSTDRKGRSHD